MNVTYKDLKEGYILKVNDKIVIHGALHMVCLSLAHNEYYLAYNGVSDNALERDRIPGTSSNDFIFQLLHISDKYSFVKDIAGKDFSDVGSFPQVKTLKALTNVAIALLEKPLYNICDYVTVRKEIEGHRYSIDFLEFMQEFAGKTFYVTEFERNDYFDHITDGEIYQYRLSCGYLWDFAMLMPATEEEKKFVGVLDKKESEKKEEEKIHFVTLEYLKEGYIFKESDHIRINGMDCVIHTNVDDTRFWLSSDTILEQEIYDSLGIPDDERKELAELCGAVDLSYHSPEFSSLECLSNFVKKILMYKKEDEKPSKKKWSGNPTYFDLKDGRILEKGDILNIHGIEYRVTCGTSKDSRYWLTAPGTGNSIIFDKLRIDDKYAFVNDICAVVSTGDFPEVGSYEDLTKVAIALFQVPEFKVGDKVRIAHREGKEGDYSWYFTDEMTKLESKEYTIKRVYDVMYLPVVGDKVDKRFSEDPHSYYLDGRASEFCWHSSMLEKVSESDKKPEESSKEETFSKPLQITLSDLQSGYVLKNDDIVCLCGERYKVHGGKEYRFLCNISGGLNRSVFNKLGIINKEYFCSSYGRTFGGDFPEFRRPEDLTACVKQLMLLEEQTFCCKGGSGDKPLPEAIKCERINFTMNISESDEPSDTGTVRLPEIKDDFKIIL